MRAIFLHYYCLHCAPKWDLIHPPTRFLLLFAAPALALLLFCFWRLRIRASRVILLLLMLGAIPYTAELYLAAGLAPSDPQWSIDQASRQSKQKIAEVARGFGVDMDIRDRADLVAEFHKQYVDAVPSVLIGEVLTTDGVLKTESSFNGGELLPLGGVSAAVTVMCNEAGQYVTYRSDEHGFRNPPGIWNTPHADVAAVGESTIAGYCVSDGKGFVDRLRTRFPATLNLGISGQSSLLQLAAIKEYLPPFAPKVVLWVFSEEIDLLDLYDESAVPLVKRYLKPGFTQDLVARQTEIDGALRGFLAKKAARERQRVDGSISMRDEWLARMKLWALRRKLDVMYGLGSGYENALSTLDATGEHLFSRALGHAKSVTGSWGGTLYFVYIPSWSRYANGSNATERERTRVFERVKALGIPIIDVRAAFDAHKDPLSLFWFRRTGHFNDDGNKVVADTILTCLSASAHGSKREVAVPVRAGGGVPPPPGCGP